jgi:hypothetical protein
MKKLLLFAAVACFILNIFSGCQKDEYALTTTANIDGMAFKASGANVVLTGKGIDTLTATSDVYTPGSTVRPVIVLYIPQRVGTFAIGKEANANVTTATTVAGGVGAISGEVSVLNIENGQMHGSFNFKLGNGMSVTGGHFVGRLP